MYGVEYCPVGAKGIEKHGKTLLDIVKKLDIYAADEQLCDAYAEAMIEAVEEIKRLRAALEKIADLARHYDCP